MRDETCPTRLKGLGSHPECRERMSETKASNRVYATLKLVQYKRVKISRRHFHGGHDFKATKERDKLVKV